MATLICDFGGVLFTDTDPQRRVEVWRSAGAGEPAVETSPDLRGDLLLARGSAGDHEGAVNLDVLDVLGRLRERGWQLIGATEVIPDVGRPGADRFSMVLDLFDRVVSSQDVGCGRPDPRFFAELRGAARPGSRLYVDDDPHNVAAARRAGLDAHLFTTAAALEAACRHLLVAAG